MKRGEGFIGTLPFWIAIILFGVLIMALLGPKIIGLFQGIFSVGGGIVG